MKTFLLMIAIILIASLRNFASAQDDRNRERISPSGTIVGNVFMVNNKSPVRGDLIAAKVEAYPDETISFQVHLYNLYLGDEFKPDEAMRIVRSSSVDDFKVTRGVNARYESRTQDNVVTAQAKFVSGAREDYSVAVFFPYNIARFPRPGAYALRYRLRVLVDGKVKDNYFVNKLQFGQAKSIEEITIYRLAAGSGPETTRFNLLGADSR